MMFFKKKLKKKQMDDRLLHRLLELKKEWQLKRDLLQNSYESPMALLYEEKLVKAKYLFLLKEAKKRNVTNKH